MERMNLRRLSTMIDREKLRMPERMEPPRSSGKKTSNLLMLTRQAQPSFQPMRSRPPRSTGTDNKPIQPSAGPGQYLNPTPRIHRSTTDELDGISVLPSTSVKEQSGRSATKNLMGTSQPKSRIPQKAESKSSVSGSTKRRSFLTAKKRLSMSNKQTAKRSLHHRLESAARRSPVASRASSDSTKQFEADELATEMPTPAPNLMRPTATSCPCKCTESLQEMKVIHKEMVTFQKELLAKQTATIDKQNELIQKQIDVLIKLNTLLDKNIKFFNHSVNVNDHQEDMESINDVNDRQEDMESVNDKENDYRDGNQSVIGERAALHYNDIRSGFNFLSLKTPAKSAEVTALTPKTPKSLLSRTLQMQLGDIFEES